MKTHYNRFPSSLKTWKEALIRCFEAFFREIPIQKIFLFGSHALDQANLESDVDLCIVTRDPESQISQAKRLRTVIGQIRDKPALSLVPISLPRLWEKQKAGDPFFLKILEKGICLAEED